VNPSVVTPATPSLSAELAHRVEAFEVLLEVHPNADLAPHLPPPDHPLYLAVLGELIRIDMEHAWATRRPKRIADYAPRFPALLVNPALLSSVAFEEYRQRVRAGENVGPDEYRHRFGVSTSGWATFDPDSAGRQPAQDEPEGEPEEDGPPTRVIDGAPPRHSDALGTGMVPTPPPTEDRLTPAARRAARERALSDAEAVAHQQEAAASLPDVGTTFVGFHLVEELGRGAFGRVYLARQGDLAGRLMALKVASGLAGESNTLAQLQHPNIVPIYSYHAAGPFQAVCMPYFGGTTLAQVVRHLGSRPGVPSSGKELRSTLTRGKVDTSVAPGVPGAPDAPGTPGTTASHLSNGSAGSVRSVANAQPAQLPGTAGETEGWARLEGLPYVEAVLALGAQIADGLAHAHARGILHRDLKPANVLLTDDGRPMLLDFNLAEDTKLRGTVEWASIGGTLPYMAPEHMEAFRAERGALDGRCDIYGLGVILCELLLGRHPFPIRRGPARQIVPLMIADRGTVPSLRAQNRSVSPGAEAIIQKCLAPNPTDRYQSAEHLREDIDRHLANRPLKYAPDRSVRERARKWVRRHPRLTSSGTVAALAAVVLVLVCGAAVYSRERTRDLESRGRYATHQTTFRDAQTFLDDQTRSRHRLDESLEHLRTVLKGYDVPEDGTSTEWQSAPTLRHLSAADRERVTGDIGETFFLMAQVAQLKATAATDDAERATYTAHALKWNELAERYGGERLPRAVREQRAKLTESRAAEAQRPRTETEPDPSASARDLYLTGSQLTRQGRHREGVRHLERATRLDPENFSAWFLRGTAHLALEQDQLAAMCFGACVALRPEYAPAWLNRGFAFFRLRDHDRAREDYDQALKLDPNLTEAYIQRAEVLDARADYDGAIGDYTKALETGAAPARVYFKRATAKYLKKDFAGAKTDRDAGFKITPADELSWVARAENRLQFAADPKGALADADEALKINPWSVFALQLKAAILSESLNRPDDAIAVLNRAVELHPDYVPARAGRGVLLARAGKRDDALRDAKDALRRDTRAPNLYQVGCIYALTAKTHAEDKREALPLLWGGLKTGFALDIVDTDTDLDALRNDPDFKDMVKDAKALNAPRQRKD
jgi:serine/threonine protein kinase/Flp pilus assembly protein TadD